MKTRNTFNEIVWMAFIITGGVALFTIAGDTAAVETHETQWPQLHGPNADGHAAPTATPPLVWSEERGVRWKIAVPERGWSSPVVHAGKVWLSTASEDGKKLFALAFDARDGRIVHHVLLGEVAVPQKRHPTNSYASPTPVIAANRVVMTFGYAGTFCLDTTTAKILWSRSDLECDHHNNAAGSSPVAYTDPKTGRTLIVFHMDGTIEQYIVALDLATGATVWRVARDFDYAALGADFRKAYGTPAIAHIGDRAVLVSPAAHRTWCYDITTGEAIWSFAYDGGFSNAVRPVFWRDRVLLDSGFPRAKLFSVPLDARGVIPDESVAWVLDKNVTLTAMPIVFGDAACVMVDGGGVVTSFDLETGETLWIHRLTGNYWASPILAAGRLYFFNEQGTTTVLEADRSGCRVLATNTLESGCMATPAFVGPTIFVRTKTHLYALEGE